MNNKIIPLLLSILIAVMFTSCNIFKESEPDVLDLLDPQKAREVALEYMENKYGEEFEVVKSFKYHYATERCVKVIVNKADDVEKKEYQVKVYLDEEDKTTHYVHSDNYMYTLAKPFFTAKMDEIFEQINTEYIGNISRFTQLGTQDSSYFFSDFPVPTADMSFEDLVANYKFEFDYELHIPISIYNDEFDQKLLDTFTPYFTDDFVSCRLAVYSDEDFYKLKNASDWIEVYENDGYQHKDIVFKTIDFY